MHNLPHSKGIDILFFFPYVPRIFMDIRYFPNAFKNFLQVLYELD
jgi:hypothetical protein